MILSRRCFLSSATVIFAAPRIAFAKVATQRRFVFVIQRGAADGLHTVIPYAEPAYARLRGSLAIDPADALKLNGSFALHPSLTGIASLYKTGQANIFHAIASPYRNRSHFDGQNILETGGTMPFQLKDGWMNRLAGMLSRQGKEAIAFTPTLPLALRGEIDVTSFASSALPDANEDLLLRIQQLYKGDAQLHALWSSVLQAQGMAGRNAGSKDRQSAAELGKVAAGFLARANGPRIAMIETNGWDTHSAQHARMATQLRNLNDLIVALQQGLGNVWDHTTVLIATEFGRTVGTNGTGGTDHGTAAAAMLLGGAVKGGRIIADWPGLGPNDLLENRDLRPTLGLDALIAHACAESFQLDPERTARVLFPNSGQNKAISRLLRS